MLAAHCVAPARALALSGDAAAACACSRFIGICGIEALQSSAVVPSSICAQRRQRNDVWALHKGEQALAALLSRAASIHEAHIALRRRSLHCSRRRCRS